MAHSFLGFLNDFRYDAAVRSMAACVFQTLSVAAAGCGQAGSAIDAALRSDAPAASGRAIGVD